ncbi:cytochrome D1 domain-containing protein [Acidobacterium sp. S8]|uniref:cytochrome D1 domain-containing protein n=1 Tax=Acidobacterium sp. S8 TaxID=1641854 RepID=UPI00131C4063|nr:cytochrome D1 domain-containing protein [Acidobacterium sp. S8]
MRNLRLFGRLLPGLCLGAASMVLMAQSAPRAVLLVANQKDQSLSVIDPETNKQIAAVPENAYTGHEVAASPDGKTAYVPIYGNSGVGKPGTDGSTMDIIDIASHKVTHTLDFGRGVRPHCAKYDKASGLLYVTTELDHSVTAIDLNTGKIAGTIPTGQAESHMLAITRDGHYGYTANVGPGTVSVLDLKARKNVTVIPVATHVQRISLSNDDKSVFTVDYTKPRLAVIDTATNKVKTWVELPSIGYGTASTKDGHWLLVALTSANKVAVVDLTTLKVARTIDVPEDPTEILVRPDGAMAYVSCGASGKVAALDIPQWKVTATIDAGKGADGLAWAHF